MENGEIKCPGTLGGRARGLRLGVNTVSRDSDDVKGQIEKYFSLLHTRHELQAHLQRVYFARFFDSPDYRGNFWGCSRFSVDPVLSLWQKKQFFGAHYTGLVHCGNAICCPVCASNIATARGNEIKIAVPAWLGESSDNTCFMVTLTFAHQLSDCLSDLLQQFKTARENFWRNGSVKRYLKRAGVVGRITSTEIQFSDAFGWHPHQHVLCFARRSFDVSANVLQKYYLSALHDAGLSGLNGIALNVTECLDVGSYLCKSGISREMTAGHLKQGRGAGHYSPMQLAFESAEGASWATDRFFELFLAVRGMHSLYWSRGLKARFGIVDRTDEQVAVDSGDVLSERLLDLYAPDWHKLSQFERITLQTVAATGKIKALEKLCDGYGVRYWREHKKER